MTSPTTTKLWHDDTRPPPDNSWIWTRTNAQAIAVLLEHSVVEASLDHDLEFARLPIAVIQRVADHQDFLLVDLLTPENTCPDTGFELAVWMVANRSVPARLRIHSWNPTGAAAMAKLLEPHAVVELREWSESDAAPCTPANS